MGDAGPDTVGDEQETGPAPRECRADECHNPVHARGVCAQHYREVRHGLDPDDVRTRVHPDAPIKSRIAAHSTIDPAGHLRWDGFMSRGAPFLAVGRSNGSTGRTMLNVRVFQLEADGHPRPPGRWIARTSCGNERCVRPDHLYWDNRRRDVAVTADQADEFIAAYEAHKLNVSDAADALGVSRQTLYKAMTKRGWKPRVSN